MLSLLGLFASNPLGRLAAYILAGVIWTGLVFSFAYLKGANNQSRKDEIRRKDAIITSLAADLKRNQDFAEKIKNDIDTLEKEKEKQDSIVKDYEQLLEERRLKDEKDTRLVPRNQCPKVCGVDNDFLNAIRRGLR